MAVDTAEDDKLQIRLLLQRINQAWLKGPAADIPAALDGCFHPAMVIRGPEFRLAGQGSATAVESYAAFLRMATVRNCSLSEPEIDLAGDTAAATYSWKMTYELNGKEYTEAGYDVFMLSRTEDHWIVTWRATLPAASPAAD